MISIRRSSSSRCSNRRRLPWGRGLNREKGITVIAAIHDLNLAAIYFDRLVMLKEGRIFADGPPSQVITEETIRKVFSASVLVTEHPSTKTPYIVITPRKT